MSLIDFEIDEVSKLCENVIENSKLVTCIRSLVGTGTVASLQFVITFNLFYLIQVRVDIKHSASKQLTVCLRFPESYPNHNILVELKSKSLCSKLLEGLTDKTEQKAKEILGKPQV